MESPLSNRDHRRVPDRTYMGWESLRFWNGSQIFRRHTWVLRRLRFLVGERALTSEKCQCLWSMYDADVVRLLLDAEGLGQSTNICKPSATDQTPARSTLSANQQNAEKPKLLRHVIQMMLESFVPKSNQIRMAKPTASSANS